MLGISTVMRNCALQTAAKRFASSAKGEPLIHAAAFVGGRLEGKTLSTTCYLYFSELRLLVSSLGWKMIGMESYHCRENVIQIYGAGKPEQQTTPVKILLLKRGPIDEIYEKCLQKRECCSDNQCREGEWCEDELPLEELLSDTLSPDVISLIPENIRGRIN